LLLIVLWTVINTLLVFSAVRSTSPSTCSWTFLTPWSVCFLSSIISCSYAEVSWADGLVLRHFWNSPQC
jgi:hypothetical protein